MVFFFFRHRSKINPRLLAALKFLGKAGLPLAFPPRPHRTHTRLASPMAVLVFTGKGQVDDLLNSY